MLYLTHDLPLVLVFFLGAGAAEGYISTLWLQPPLPRQPRYASDRASALGILISLVEGSQQLRFAT